MHFNILDGVVSNLDIESGVSSRGKFVHPAFQLKGVGGGDFVWLGLPEGSFEEPEDVISDGDRISVLYKGRLKKHTIAMAHYNYRTKTMYEAKWRIGVVLVAVFLLMWICLLPSGFTLIHGGVNPVESFAIASCIPLFMVIFASFLTYQGYAASKALKMHCQKSSR